MEITCFAYSDSVIFFIYIFFLPTEGQDLFIGKAVQKAYLEVTEEGAEGAAGSGDINRHILL